MTFLEHRIPPPVVALLLGIGVWWLTRGWPGTAWLQDGWRLAVLYITCFQIMPEERALRR